jgi:uncharacterized damage-inducible protein DinB
MADKLAQLLKAHFDSVFAGPNGDYPAVLEALAEITADHAAWKPGPDNNSIWQIVDHLSASNVWQQEMLEKGQAASPVWSEPPGGEAAWLTSLNRLRETHANLMTALDSLSDEELLGIPVPEWRKTLLELLLSSAAHEACHAGQIDYLKGLASVKSA